MNKEILSIRFEFWKGNLSANWEGYDVKASMEKFAEHLANYLYADYPDAEIEVVPTKDTRCILVNGIRDHPALENIRSIESKVWYDEDFEMKLD